MSKQFSIFLNTNASSKRHFQGQPLFPQEPADAAEDGSGLFGDSAAGVDEIAGRWQLNGTIGAKRHTPLSPTNVDEQKCLRK